MYIVIYYIWRIKNVFTYVFAMLATYITAYSHIHMQQCVLSLID